MSPAGRPSARDTGDPADLLSAYLDDELDGDERADLEQALVDSPQLRVDLDELRTTQAMLRSLPLIEPLAAPLQSAGAEEVAAPVGAAVVPIGQRRRRRTAVAATVGAMAAALLVLVGLGATLDPMPVAPPVDELAFVHMGAAGDAGDFVSMDAEAMGDTAVLAGLGDGMDRRAVYARDDLVHTVYSDGRHEVSVFHQPGVVDWEALPVDGTMTSRGAEKTWIGVRDGTVVTVTERGDLTVVIVADADMGTDQAMAKALHAAEMVPLVAIERSLWERLSEAPANLFDRI